jgi:hypothetical protein
LLSPCLRALSEQDLHLLEIRSRFHRAICPNPNAFGLRKSYPTNGLLLLAYTVNYKFSWWIAGDFLSAYGRGKHAGIRRWRTT